MWDPWRLTTLWASTACYRDSFAIRNCLNSVSTPHLDPQRFVPSPLLPKRTQNTCPHPSNFLSTCPWLQCPSVRPYHLQAAVWVLFNATVPGSHDGKFVCICVDIRMFWVPKVACLIWILVTARWGKIMLIWILSCFFASYLAMLSVCRLASGSR
jgi:hypothetical protein